MNEITQADKVTRADVERLQAAITRELKAGRQVVPEIRTHHYYADGMYLRELWRPAGCTIVGKVHKREHFYLVIQGSVLVSGEGMQPTRFDAPAIVVSAPGTKRAVHALTDATCCTVHRVSDLREQAQDLKAIEAALIEPDETALFDENNRLKVEALEHLP